MNKGRRLISNTLILGAGTFASKLIVLLMMPFYTAWLSPEQFGVADLVAQTANMIIPIACIGISEGLFRFALDCEDKKKVFSTALTALFFGTVAMLALLPMLTMAAATSATSSPPRNFPTCSKSSITTAMCWWIWMIW